MIHQSGKEPVADLGTKVHGPIRFSEMKTLMNLEKMPEPALEKVMADDLIQRIAEEDAEARGRTCVPPISGINVEEDSKKIA